MTLSWWTIAYLAGGYLTLVIVVIVEFHMITQLLPRGTTIGQVLKLLGEKEVPVVKEAPKAKEPIKESAPPPQAKPSHILTVPHVLGNGWVIEYLGDDYAKSDKQITDMIKANPAIKLEDYEKTLGIKIVRADGPQKVQAMNDKRTLDTLQAAISKGDSVIGDVEI
jgi:hypothetical protein